MTQYSDLPFYEKLFILQRLPHDKFKLLCIADRQMTPVCMGNLTPDIIEKHGSKVTEELYHRRSENMFNSSLLQFKQEEMSWKEFYTRLNIFIDDLEEVSNQIHINKLIAYGKIMEARILYSIRNVNIPYTVISLLNAEKTNTSIETKLELLQWLKEINKLDFDRYPLQLNTIETNIPVAKFLLDNNIVPDDVIFAGLVNNNKIEALNLFASYEIYPGQWATNKANTIEMVKWFYDHQPGTLLPDDEALMIYMKYGQTDILEFWNDHIRPLTQQDVDNLLHHVENSFVTYDQNLGITNTLDWFESKGILPSFNENYQIQTRTIRSWLKRRNLLL